MMKLERQSQSTDLDELDSEEIVEGIQLIKHKSVQGLVLEDKVNRDESLAKLIYMKCLIDHGLQHAESDQTVKQFEDLLMKNPESKNNKIIVVYYIRTMM